MKLPGEERQCCFVAAGKVIPEASSSVQTWFFQFNIDAFIDSSLKPSVFSVQSVPFPSDGGALLGLDLKRWLSYVVPCSCGAVVRSLLHRDPYTPPCTALHI